MKLSLLIFDIEHLSDLFKIAKIVDKNGFSRMWLGEHYGRLGVWNNPEPLIPVILGVTDNITVGAAGILLKLHSPLRIASSFRLMNVMYPERVDLGLASAISSINNTKYFLNQNDIESLNFYKSVEQINDFYKKEDEYIKQGVIINPAHSPLPNLWLLSTSFNNLDKALIFGLNYSISLFHLHSNNSPNLTKLNKFKADFKEKHGRFPVLNIAFSGILTKNDNETRKFKKEINDLPSSKIMVNIIGTIEDFYFKIDTYINKYGIDDITFLDVTPGVKRRINNVKLLSKKFNLKNIKC